jgi:uncharacterized membrane protein HdeD (DUF308 family)
MMELSEKEKTRRIIGAVMLAVGTLCLLWGEQSGNAALMKLGKTAAATGIVIYFLGRIGKLLRRGG